jgi:hypothetical protein
MWLVVLLGIGILTGIFLSLQYSGLFSMFDFVNGFLNNENATFWVFMLMTLLLLGIGLAVLRMGSKDGFALSVMCAMSVTFYTLAIILV